MSSDIMQGINLIKNDDEVKVEYFGRLVFNHSRQSPAMFVGKGFEDIEMYRGNFKISDYVSERIPLYIKSIEDIDDGYKIEWSITSDFNAVILKTHIYEFENRLEIEFIQIDKTYNRSWIRLDANKNEKVYGCGEQLSYFNLRGKHFPLWTSEPGVGRNKENYTTFLADVKDKAGGDYYNTNYPQPTFISTEKYYCHAETTAYADFDFRNSDFHELQFWEVPGKIIFSTADTFKELQKKLSDLLGKQPELPDWTYEGVWLGIQGGTEVVDQKIKEAEDAGLKVGAVWCQDWQGRRITSFGKRLQWNWQWDSKQYPELDRKIFEWKNKGIKFLGYFNPYLANDGPLFEEAQRLGLLAKNFENEYYLVDFGEFCCGVVDFTNPKASEWFKNIIRKYGIDFGLDGWMADFGEYLPTDVVLYDNSSPMLRHNEWPKLWADVNKKAISEAGKSGEIVYFMRAGYTGIQSRCPLLWGGDQSVNWSIDDGLASVIPAALSAGVSGMGLHHSDIGGYTSLHGNKRTKELLMRWAEMAAFTPVMRTHEGNRPDDCFQYDSDKETLNHMKQMVDVYTGISPYVKDCVRENSVDGIPVQRPLFYEFENDVESYNIQYQYMLGKDILVAPVYERGVTNWEVYLPDEKWIHLWSGKEFDGGHITIEAPIGKPPVFYRKNSEYKDCFDKASKEFHDNF